MTAKWIFYTVAGVLLIGIVLAWLDSSAADLSAGLPSALIAISRLAALAGTYLLLMQLVLVSRAPWVEKVHGFDSLTRIHRWNGFAAFALVTLHIPLVIVGNALLRESSLPAQFTLFINEFDYIWMAALGYVVLILTVALSVTIVRRKLRYETWHLVHLFNYAVLVLIIWHQVTHGTTLLTHEVLLWAWYGLYVGVFANIIFFRFLMPVWQYKKHRFYVDSVVAETADTHSIYIKGKRMRDFGYEAGQFGKWRFLSGSFWKEEHPFTISNAMNGRYLRITPKAVGDFTASLPGVEHGTPVLLSGPLGSFTLSRARSRKILLVAGGIGITPLRAMVEGAPRSYDMVLVYAARKKSDFVFTEELNQIMAGKKRRLYYVTTQERAKGAKHASINEELLKNLVSDIADRDIFICGPPAMIDKTTEAARSLGADKSRVHSERFSL